MNKWQMAGFTLANICGLFICLLSIQFYADIVPLYSGHDSIIKPGQMVLNKKVSLVRAINGNASTFSDAELKDIASQPFVDSLACFGSADFPVMCTIGSPALGTQISSYMFFEAVPDSYLDADLSEWTYEVGDTHVPIILPKNYLNLYNFGFAKSQGLPNISESMIKQVLIQLHIGSGTNSMTANAHIVGFSQELNTILVPQSFLDYANNRFSTSSHMSPSRVIIRVNNPADTRIDRYLTEHNLEAESGNNGDAKISRMLSIALAMVLVVGIIICSLAFYLLLMSVFILLQKNMYKIQTLLYIGYAPHQIVQPFVMLAVATNVFSALAAVVLTAYARGFYMPEFDELAESYSISFMYPALFAAVILCIAMIILNIIAVRRHIIHAVKQ